MKHLGEKIVLDNFYSACSLWGKCWNLQKIPGRLWYWAAFGSVIWGVLIKLTAIIEGDESLL